jgi:hypothetical protein
MGVAVQSTAFTSLAYMRWMIDAQSIRKSKLWNLKDPYIVEIVMQGEEFYPLEVSRLDLLSERERVSRYILSSKSTLECEFVSNSVRCLEGPNRYIFLGTFAYCWILFVDELYGHVLHIHIVEYLAFCMCEINGTTMLVAVIFHLLKPSMRKKVMNALSLEGIRAL